jgi:hypothetical protein
MISLVDVERRERLYVHSVIPPMISMAYLHPMFEPLEQHGVIPVWQAGYLTLQAHLGTVPQLIKHAVTTPRGWKVERVQRRKRRRVGRNSRQMRASMGMFPPTPKPENTEKKGQRPAQTSLSYRKETYR